MVHGLEFWRIGWAAVNHYDVLHVPVDADDGTIRSAFRKLARQYHPDVGTGSSLEKFREVTEAYETLIDPLSRRTYDQSLNRSKRIPIHVEPLRANPEPLRSRPAMVRPVYSGPSALDFTQLIDRMFSLIEEEFLFDWHRFRY